MDEPAPDVDAPLAAAALLADRSRAGILAALVGWRTRNVLLTIGVGMAALLILQQVLK